MNNKDNKEKLNNQIYCCFDNDANTLEETLKVSFSDYLVLKENKESLANTSKES